MSLTILASGMQATLQGNPRLGFRHQGVPSSGPADSLSHALANIALGNEADTANIEITGGGFKAVINAPISIALTGAPSSATLNNVPLHFYTPIHANAGDTLIIPPPSLGLRIYLAVTGGFEAQTFLKSTSTYLPANFGGHLGRGLQKDDILKFADNPPSLPSQIIPQHIRPFFSRQWSLRFCEGPEFHVLTQESAKQLTHSPFKASSRLSRMGIQLEGTPLNLSSDGKMKSAPVFAGTIQCPENGLPFILLADAQTTGGYPRIGTIASCDRHRLGQIQAGDQITLISLSPEAALTALKQKLSALAALTTKPLT
ncbi:biotin-dependent carboxyltransferase family protein [Hirschia litorea]|uniref:Biotin-dependent carboxyltransferase family protein n=1 Tax=Hirschia litorea TaxID=1199156 RepID=A0ABW2ILU6_9PROT